MLEKYYRCVERLMLFFCFPCRHLKQHDVEDLKCQESKQETHCSVGFYLTQSTGKHSIVLFGFLFYLSRNLTKFSKTEYQHQGYSEQFLSLLYFG